MSYAVSAALQSAIFGALSADPTLSDLVGGAIYDALPSGALPPLYVSIGQEVVRERNDSTGIGAEHQMTIKVVTEVAGFVAAKEVGGAICDALHETPLTLSRGRLVSMKFTRGQASKIEKGAGRQIDLIFRARVEDD